MKTEKQLSDYIHLYLGCDMICTNENCNSDHEYFGMRSNNSAILMDKHCNGNWKLILRKLSDITDEEQKTIDTELWDFWSNNRIMTPEVFAFLLSKHFDLFDLIDSDLAIDKATVK